jgi:hypothetical protein
MRSDTSSNVSRIGVVVVRGGDVEFCLVNVVSKPFGFVVDLNSRRTA